MRVYIFFVSVISVFNAVISQNDIMDIFDTLGIDLLDLLTGQINIEDIVEEACKDIRNSSRDDLCVRQLKIVCDNETFRSTMLDSASKYPYSGMYVKTRLDYGTYDECIDLDLTENGTRVIGKHCLGGLVIPTTELNDTDVVEKAYKLSICIPDGCSAEDLMSVFNATTDLPLINDYSCSTKESWKKLTADDYAVIVFLLLIVTVMAVSTIYDVYLYYTNKKCPHILLQAFSVYYNGRKLLQVSKGPSEQIKVIHGLKVISMIWIIAGHSFGTMARFPGVNTDFPVNFESSWKSIYITGAHLGVDTFFFISGLLLAYQYLKLEPKPLKTQIRRLPFLYLHRYLRITPAVAMAFLVTITLLMHMGNGPAYHNSTQVEKDACLNHWWSFFLYVQNYVNYDDLCILNTWYLSADWQLFLISPIIVIPVSILIKRHFRWVMGQLLLLNILLTVATMGFKFLMQDYDNQFETHSYLNVYFIGFMLGTFMREKCNMKYPFSTTGNFVMWVIALLTLVSTLLAYKELQLMEFLHDYSYRTYFILTKVFWSMGLSWIIYSCHNGYGGFINWLLTTPLAQVLSKLTYCMYITHVCPVMYFRLISRQPVVYNQMTGFTDSLVAYFSTILIAVFWTLAFESPLIILEKYFLGAKR